MGFTVRTGQGGLGPGQSLNNLGDALLETRAANDAHARSQEYIAAAKRALAEHDAERAAMSATGEAQAQMAVGLDGGAQPKFGSVPQGVTTHAKTGLPDYRDPATLEDRMGQIKALRSTFPQTPEGNAAYGAFATEQGQLIQSHLLDNQEAEAVDGIANMVHSMTLTAGAAQDSILEGLSAETTPRLKSIEDTIRAAKNIKDLKLRSSIVETALKEVPAIQEAIAKDHKTSREKVEAATEVTQYRDSLPIGDPRRQDAEDAKVAIAMGAPAKDVADALIFKGRGYVKTPGGWQTKDQAEFDAKAANQQRLSDQAQEKNALEGRKQTEDERKNRATEALDKDIEQWKRTHPLARKADTLAAQQRESRLFADSVAGKNAGEKGKASPEWMNAYEANLHSYGDEASTSNGTAPTAQPDEPQRPDGVSDAEWAYIKAQAGIK